MEVPGGELCQSTLFELSANMKVLGSSEGWAPSLGERAGRRRTFDMVPSRYSWRAKARASSRPARDSLARQSSVADNRVTDLVFFHMLSIYLENVKNVRNVY